MRDDSSSAESAVDDAGVEVHRIEVETQRASINERVHDLMELSRAIFTSLWKSWTVSDQSTGLASVRCESCADTLDRRELGGFDQMMIKPGLCRTTSIFRLTPASQCDQGQLLVRCV